MLFHKDDDVYEILSLYIYSFENIYIVHPFLVNSPKIVWKEHLN